jgi:rubrerythrin
VLKPQDKLVKFLQKQIEVEKKIVESINEALGEMANPVVKTALKGISLDSLKHAEMYAAAVRLLTDIPPALSQELTQYDLDKQRKLIENHVRMEVELMEQLTEMMQGLENKKVELLLDAILQDERKHHELLKRMLEILVRGETMTDEWWKVLNEEYVPRW